MKKLGFLMLTLLLFACSSDQIQYPANYEQVNLKEVFNVLYGYAEKASDEYAGSMVAGSDGTIYFTVNEDGQLAIVALDRLGEKKWSYAWDDTYYDGVFNCDKNEWQQGGMVSSLTQDSNYLYAVLNSSDVPANNIFSVVVLKIRKLDGSLVWAKKWNHFPQNVPTAKSNDLAYGVAVDQKNVYVTGTLGNDQVFLLVFDKENAELKYQGQFELSPVAKDVATVIKVAPDGTLLISGMSGNKTFLAKFYVNTKDEPQLIWLKSVSPGYKVCVDDMDIDDEGNIYLAFNVEGMSSKFMIAKLNEKSDFLWMKIFPAERSKLNSTRTVKLIDDKLYVGGRVALKGLNGKTGDGLLLKLDKQNGKVLAWYAYYTGKEDNDMSMHTIEAIAKSPDGLIVFGQVLGGKNNVSNYHGVWLTDNNIASEESKLSIEPWSGDVVLEQLNGEVKDVKDKYFINDIKLTLPTEKKMVNAPDFDVFLIKLKDI